MTPAGGDDHSCDGHQNASTATHGVHKPASLPRQTGAGRAFRLPHRSKDGYSLGRMECDQKTGGFAIGPIAVDGGAVLAPLSGVTDVAFRRIARRFGAGVVVSEMVASDELVRGTAEAHLRAEGAGISPHVVQLAGCEPRWLGEAARLAEDRKSVV